MVSFLQVMEARLLWLNARADMVKELGYWERAWVQLGLHQGVLPAGCDCPKAASSAVKESATPIKTVKPEAAMSVQPGVVLPETVDR